MLFRGAKGSKTSKTAVLTGFCKIERGGSSGSAPPCYRGLIWLGRAPRRWRSCVRAYCPNIYTVPFEFSSLHLHIPQTQSPEPEHIRFDCLFLQFWIEIGLVLDGQEHGENGEISSVQSSLHLQEGLSFTEHWLHSPLEGPKKWYTQCFSSVTNVFSLQAPEFSG